MGIAPGSAEFQLRLHGDTYFEAQFPHSLVSEWSSGLTSEFR